MSPGGGVKLGFFDIGSASLKYFDGFIFAKYKHEFFIIERMPTTNCMFCGTNLLREPQLVNSSSLLLWHSCQYCGEYVAGSAFDLVISRFSPDDLAKVRAYLMERQLLGQKTVHLCTTQSEIPEANLEGSVGLDYAIAAFPRLLNDRISRAILNLYRKQKHLGDFLPYENDKDYPVVFGLTREEGLFVLSQLEKLGYLNVRVTSGKSIVTILPAGINYVHQLEEGRGGALSKQVFVAMAFRPELDVVYDNAIKKAIEDDCGFVAYRVDKTEHNEKIDDLIVSEIKRSKFLVADLTAQRNGVYFEAGMMMGLGRPVIFTVNESDADSTHFDTRQYNQIRWKTPADLREQLHRRIRATIGVASEIRDREL